MKVLEAAQRSHIKIVPDGKGGADIIGPRTDVERIVRAVAKRERRNAKRMFYPPCTLEELNGE